MLADPEAGIELGPLLGADSRVLAPSVLEEGGDKPHYLDALTGAEKVLYAPSVPSPTSMSRRVTACSTRSGGLSQRLPGWRRRRNW